MPSSRIPSPARSQGARATPRRYKPRASRSVGSPARSTSSVKLSDVVKSCLEPFVLSPMPTRRSILPDTSDIDVPTRKSWWKRLNDDTRDVMDMVNTRDPELNKKAIEDIIEVEVLSQEQKEYTFDLPESSDNESISSIVIPQRKLFTQKDICPVTKYGQIVDLRGSPSKKQESHIVDERTLNVGRKKLFNQGAKTRSKPIFPLLHISADKTLINKTKELPTKEPKAGTRNLFGNQPNQKRKNMFTNFVMSDSEESEILEIQPKVFEFPKNQEQEWKDTSKVNREPSPSNSMDIELDDWQLLPSSTMVEQQIEDGLLNTPSKRARLGKFSDITKTNNTTANKTRQSNRSMNAKNKSANSSKLKEAEVNELVVPSHEELNHSAVNQNTTRRSLRNKDLSVKNVTQDRSLRNISKTKDNSKSKNSTKIGVVTNAVVESADQKIEDSKNKSNRSKTSKTMSRIDQALQSDDDNDFTLEYDDEPVRDDGENKTTMENKTQNQHQNLKHARNSSSNNTSKLQTDASEKGQQITEVRTSKTMQPENDHQKEPLEDIFSKENPHTTINKIIGDISHNNSQNKSSKNQNETNKSNRLTITKVLTVDQEIAKEKQANTKHSEDKQANLISEDVNRDYEIQEKNKGEEKLKNAYNIDNEQLENDGGVQDHTQSIRQEIEHDKVKITKDNQEVSEAVGDAQEANVSDEIDSDEGEYVEDHHEENATESEEEQEQNESEQNTTQENENEDEDSEKENHEESAIEDEEQADESEHNISQEIENDDEEIEEDKQEDAEAEEENQQTTNGSEKNVSQEMENNDDEMQEENENSEDTDEDVQQINENEQNISQAIENDEEKSQEENEDESIALDEEQEENESIAVDEDEDEENESAQHNTSVEEDTRNENEDNEEEMDQENDTQNQSHEVDNDNDMDDNGNESDDVDETPANATHDTTGKHRQKPVKVASPEVVLHDKTNQMTSFSVQGRNTSIRKTKSLIKPSIKPSMAPVTESTAFSDGIGNSSAEGSGWDSHRTTRTTLRKTFGRDFTPRKSLRALVMEKSAKRQTNIDISRFPQANSTELPTDGQFEMEIDYEETPESDHEVSRRTRQTTLETYLDKIKDENLERRKQMREKIQNDLRAFRDENRRPNILDPFKVPAVPKLRRVKAQPKAKAKAQKSTISRDMLPAEILQDMKYKPPKRFRPANASWITKRLYKYLETKLETKYDYKARVRSEKLVETIYNFTKDIRRHPTAPLDAVNVLKHEMARLDIVRTHNDFYEFFYEYMPREVRVKVVPDVINKIPVPKHVFSDIIR